MSDPSPSKQNAPAGWKLGRPHPALLAGIGCVLLPLLFAGGFGMLKLNEYLFEEATTTPTPEAQRLACYSPDDLRPLFPELVNRAEYQTIETTTLLGRTEVECLYETPAADPFPLTISTTVIEGWGEDDARDDMFAGGLGMIFAASLLGDDVQFIEKHDLFGWGDDSRTWLIQGPLGPAGNAVLVRRGDRTFLAVVVGIYFQDRPNMEQAFVPWLERAVALEL